MIIFSANVFEYQCSLIFTQSFKSAKNTSRQHGDSSCTESKQIYMIGGSYQVNPLLTGNTTSANKHNRTVCICTLFV